MADILSKNQRSLLMSRISNSNTKPEWVLRGALHRIGFRYTLNNRHLPGCPDLVFPKYKTAVFVHGCFWHGHPGCKDASIPKSNQQFWINKLTENSNRDAKNFGYLEKNGWKIEIVWECELLRSTLKTVEKVALSLDENLINKIHAKISLLNRSDLLKGAARNVSSRLRKRKLKV